MIFPTLSVGSIDSDGTRYGTIAADVLAEPLTLVPMIVTHLPLVDPVVLRIRSYTKTQP
jgi:hypothetical protein